MCNSAMCGATWLKNKILITGIKYHEALKRVFRESENKILTFLGNLKYSTTLVDLTKKADFSK